MIRINFNIEDSKHTKLKMKAFSEKKTLTEVLLKLVDGYIGKGSPEVKKVDLDAGVEIIKGHQEGEIKIIDEVKLEEVSIISEEAENSVQEIKPAVSIKPNPKFKTFFKK